MPSQTSNLTTLRTSGAFASVYMSVYKGAEVAEFTVNSTPADQAKNLAVTLVDGDGDLVRPGYRVDIYSSGGAFKGRTRVRYGSTAPGDTVLPIREHSQGVAQIVAGDTVRVYADVRLSDKLVTATADFNPDDLAYSDQGSNPPPLACSGGAWAGFASMLPIPFTGSLSDYVDPDSNGPLTHSWTWPTGLTGSSTSAADPNVTAADAGEYLVTHVVTDADNSKSTTQYVPVIVHDASNPPYEVVVEDVGGDEENGHSFSVRVFEDAALADIPDGAFCILWMEQHLAGSIQAFGAKSSGRSHILGVGYIRREEGDFDGETGVEGLRFEVISPIARLAELVGYSKVMTSEASPDAWSELKTLGTERATRQLWQFYTNASEAGFDFVTDTSYVDYTYPQLFLQKSTPLAQMRELADGTDARLTCDRTGRFSLHTRPELLAVGSRAAATKTITLTTSDIIDWSYSREHWRPTELLEARGFTYGSNPQPIFSRWPGLAPGQGNQNSTVERLIAASQSDLNARAGRRGAAADGIYVDANGAQQMALDLELTLPTGYHIGDFYDEYVAINLTTERRGLDLSGQLFVLRSVRLETGDDGTLRCVWTLRTATNGVAGVTYVPPQEADNGVPPFNPPDFYVPPFPAFPELSVPETIQLYKGAKRIALIGTLGVALTENFGSGSATAWGATVYAAMSGDTLSGTPVQWVPNGFSNPAAGWIDTTTNKYYLSIAALSLVHKHAFTASTIYRSSDASFGFENVQVTRSYHPGVGIRTTYTTDNTSFTEVLSNTFYLNEVDPYGVYPGCFVSPRIAGKVLSSGHTNTAALGSSTSQGKQSANNGATFGASTPSMVSSGLLNQYIHVPWHDNPTESVIYYGVINADVTGSFYRNSTEITPRIGGVNFLPRGSRNGVMTSPQNRQRMLMVGQRVTAPDYWAIFKTDKAGTISTVGSSDWQVLQLDTGYRSMAISGDDQNTFYFWGPGGVGLSVDGGANILSQTGNLNLATIGTVIGLAGF